MAGTVSGDELRHPLKDGGGARHSYGTAIVLENLDGHFLEDGGRGRPLAIRMSADRIEFHPTASPAELTTLLLADVVGVDVEVTPSSVRIVFHAYPVQTSGCCGGSRTHGPRRHAPLWLVVDAADAGASARLAGRWRNALRRVLRGDVPTAADLERGLSEESSREMLVFVNPVSGPGRAGAIFARDVEPVLRHAHCSLHLVVTTHAAHATEVMAETDVGRWAAVVVVGGDGLLHEVMEGMAARVDWSAAIRLPIAIVPGGSGNGLAASVLHASGEAYCPLNAAFVAARGTPTDLDVATVHTGRGRDFSFLSTAWGLTADVDIESERWRWMGSFRFQAMGLVRILRPRYYQGTVAYLPHDDAAPIPSYWAGVHPAGAAGDALARPATPLLPAEVDDHVPDGWKVIEGTFALLWACNTTHAAWDMLAAPTSELSDGLIHLFQIREGALSRAQMLRMMIDLEDGTHVEDDRIDIVRTRAYKLLPGRTRAGRSGILVADGELLDGYGPMQSEVHRGLARVIAIPPPPKG